MRSRAKLSDVVFYSAMRYLRANLVCIYVYLSVYAYLEREQTGMIHRAHDARGERVQAGGRYGQFPGRVLTAQTILQALQTRVLVQSGAALVRGRALRLGTVLLDGLQQFQQQRHAVDGVADEFLHEAATKTEGPRTAFQKISFEAFCDVRDGPPPPPLSIVY